MRLAWGAHKRDESRSYQGHFWPGLPDEDPDRRDVLLISSRAPIGVMIKSSPVEFTTSKEVRNAIPSGFTTLNVRRQVRQNKGSRMNPTTRSKRFWREGRMLVGRTLKDSRRAQRGWVVRFVGHEVSDWVPRFCLHQMDPSMRNRCSKVQKRREQKEPREATSPENSGMFLTRSTHKCQMPD